MATVGENGKIRGGKIRYHSERALEAIRWAERGHGWALITGTGTLGEMLDTLAYDHARGAARAALNRSRKVKK